LGATASFSKFTPLEVVRHLLKTGTEAQLGVKERDVTIFFSDIAGLTTICEGTAPSDVLSLLSEYFERMVSIIVEEEGTMLEFIGDAILAIWNAPSTVEDHASRAVTATLRMQEDLEHLRSKWKEEEKPNIRIRVGLHSSKVFVGNLGSKMRMKYGVLGDGVNLASRLEELNKRYGTESMASEEVVNREGMKESYVLRPIDLVVVKGRKAPTRVYEILDRRETAGPSCRQIEAQSNEAMQAYLARDFEKAIQCLMEVRKTKGKEDLAGQVLIGRCKEYIRNPPPADWDGSEVLKDKTF
jgi:adenylate cyclase